MLRQRAATPTTGTVYPSPPLPTTYSVPSIDFLLIHTR